MDQKELSVLQAYLQKKFGTGGIIVKEGEGIDVPAEVLIDGEYIGAIYKNDDEDEVSYDFMMSILPEDLE